MKAVRLKDLNYGDFFTLRDYDDSVDISLIREKSWIRCENAGSISWSVIKAFCVRWSDDKKAFFSLHRVVYTDPRL